MTTSRRKFTSEEKARIVLEILKEEKSISQLASEHGIHTNVLNRWKKQAVQNLWGDLYFNTVLRIPKRKSFLPRFAWATFFICGHQQTGNIHHYFRCSFINNLSGEEKLLAEVVIFWPTHMNRDMDVNYKQHRKWTIMEQHKMIMKGLAHFMNGAIYYK